MDKLLGLPIVSVDLAGEQPSVTVIRTAGPFEMIFGAPLIPPVTRAEVVRRKLEIEPFTIATSFFFDKSGQLYCKPIYGVGHGQEVFIWPGGIVQASGCARVVTSWDMSQLTVVLPNETVKADFGEMVKRFHPCPANGEYLSYCRYQKVDEVMDWTGEPYPLPRIIQEQEGR